MRALIAAVAVMLTADRCACPPSSRPAGRRAAAGAGQRAGATPATPSRRRNSPPRSTSSATVEFSDRMAAARTTRRADPAMAVPALLKAVESHPDGFVRFRALVLLSGLQRSADARRHARLARRCRTTACARSPTPTSSTIPIRPSCPKLLAAVATESSEFVRPALTRALAALRHRPEGPGDDGRAGDEGAGLLPQRA